MSVLRSECWEWPGWKYKSGYGRIWFNGKYWLTHRLAYYWAKKAPRDRFERLHVLHRCDNPGCYNPEHLWLGTNNDNIRDRVIKGRSYNGRGRRKV